MRWIVFTRHSFTCCFPLSPHLILLDLWLWALATWQEMNLGPNGGLVYCMDYLEKNMDWLQQALAPLEKGGCLSDSNRQNLLHPWLPLASDEHPEYCMR